MNKRLEIKETLLRNDKNISWLENKLKQRFGSIDLYYLLSDKSVNFDVNIYEEILKIFRNNGFIATESDRCKSLTQSIMHIDSVIGHSLTILNYNIASFIQDNLIDFKEKKKLSELIEKIENEFQESINNIKKIVEG